MVKVYDDTNGPAQGQDTPPPAAAATGSNSSSSRGGPPSAADLAARTAASILLALLLLTAALPFHPVSWVLHTEAGYLLDHLVSRVALFAALYFQYRVGTVARPLVISLPVGGGGGGTRLRNGRLERVDDGGADFVLFVWRPDLFWAVAVAEAAVLAVAQWGATEAARQLIVTAVVAGLWLVGWPATPRSHREWAQRQVWEFWKWTFFWGMMTMGLGGPRQRQGGRRARW